MKRESIEQQLKAIFPAHALNDWEFDELAETLEKMPEAICAEVIRYIPVIWPVSYALFFAFLHQVTRAMECLHPSQLQDWVNATLDVYEQQGLRQAQLFMEDVENAFLCRIRGETGLSFDEVAGTLQTYVRGLASSSLDLAPAPFAWTDTATIYLPPEINYPQQKANFLFYKLCVTFQWALIENQSFAARPAILEQAKKILPKPAGRRVAGCSGLFDEFFSLFDNRQLAVDLFYLLETVRIFAFLYRRFAGLMADVKDLLPLLATPNASGRQVSETNCLLAEIRSWILHGMELPAPFPQQLTAVPADLMRQEATVVDSLTATRLTYDYCRNLKGRYVPVEPLLFQGEFQYESAWARILARREKCRHDFVKNLGVLLPDLLTRQPHDAALEEENAQSAGRNMGSDDAGVVLPIQPQAEVPETQAEQTENTSTRYITIDDRDVRVPEEMSSLIQEIINDIGHIPGDYISSAVQGAGNADSSGPGYAIQSGESLEGPVVYDEWDYRRAGFRKHWCNLVEKQITPVRGTFVDNTLSKYKGLRHHLRRQFEMMRLQDRFVRRQRDGDDIDLDAMTEALADMRAGLAPSERLFVRLLRNERNIAAVFLVDMSSSTEGWVGQAIKESLILMCEALEVLGDRYAIFGFSGMRRLRAEFFHIKGIAEEYDDTVKGRIAAIAPQEYTRMGPPLRHATELLKNIDAKVRLLITLSDGKPEDYDDYKGLYAVEDTRHALIEAKAAGIHPFCVTIDREAHDYISHMYGEVNYIFIDEVGKLPSRMPEIYRNLTT